MAAGEPLITASVAVCALYVAPCRPASRMPDVQGVDGRLEMTFVTVVWQYEVRLFLFPSCVSLHAALDAGRMLVQWKSVSIFV